MFARTSLSATMLLSLAAGAAAQVSVAWSGTHNSGTSFVQRTRISCSTPLPSGGIVAGCTRSFHYQVYPQDYWVDDAVDVVRWSETGQKLWSVRLVGPKTARAIAVDAQGAIFVGVAGDPAHDVFRLDANGVEQWSNAILGSGRLQKLVLNSTGDVIVAGDVGPDATQDMMVGAFDANGTPLWSRAIDGPTGDYDWVSTLGCDGVGNIVVTGVFGHPGGLDRGVCKLDASGQIQWKSSVPDTESYPRGFALASNGDVLVGGARWAGGPTYLARLDANGTTLWETSWSDPLGYYERIVDVRIATDGTIWAMGSSVEPSSPGTTGHLVLLRYDAAGNLLSQYVHQPPGLELEYAAALVPGTAGQFYAVASTQIGLTSQAHNESIVIQFDSAGSRDWVLSLDTNPTPAFTDEFLIDGVLASGDQLVLTGSSGTLSGGDVGYAFAFDLGDSPQGYCTAKVNSQGCEPAITFTGMSSAASSSGFTVRAGNELNQKTGMMLYSVVGEASIPFQGGILCLHSPLRRTPAQSSGGSPSPVHDCTGSYAIDMNAFAHGVLGGNPDASLLVPGTTVWCQAWGRDPGFAAPDNTSLSNGLRYVVLP